MPGVQLVAARRDARKRERSVGGGPGVERRREHHDDGGHLRMDVAVDRDHSRLVEPRRPRLTAAVEPEIERAFLGEREHVVVERIVVGERHARPWCDDHDLGSERLVLGDDLHVAGSSAARAVEPYDRGDYVGRALAAFLEDGKLTTQVGPLRRRLSGCSRGHRAERQPGSESHHEWQCSGGSHRASTHSGPAPCRISSGFAGGGPGQERPGCDPARHHPRQRIPELGGHEQH